jgi:flagellar hook-associated protein 1 FlgK
VQGKAQDTIVTQTQAAQQSLSGVNLDEEAANLIRYQQAYQASGKVLQVAATLFDTILELGN